MVISQMGFANMRNKLMIFLYVISLVLVGILLSGCGTQSVTQIPAADVPLLLTPLLTHEITQPTAVPFSTATAISSPTWTPVPALPVEIREQNINELFSINGGCDFPCWWGIRLGDTIQRVAELAPVIGKSLRKDQGLVYYYTLPLDNLNTPDLNVSYHVDVDQNVQRMEVTLGQPSRFRNYYDAFEEQLSLASLLKRYGKPSEILFLVAPRFEPGETPRPYTLFLIYDIQNFGIVYSGLVDSETPLQVCSIKLDNHRLQYISLYLHNPRSKIARINRFNSAELLPLEQVTSISVDDFYRIFSEPENDRCIEVSIDAWQ